MKDSSYDSQSNAYGSFPSPVEHIITLDFLYLVFGWCSISNVGAMVGDSFSGQIAECIAKKGVRFIINHFPFSMSYFSFHQFPLLIVFGLFRSLMIC